MKDRLRPGRVAFYGTMLMLSWSLMPMVLPVAYLQPVPSASPYRAGPHTAGAPTARPRAAVADNDADRSRTGQGSRAVETGGRSARGRAGNAN